MSHLQKDELAHNFRQYVNKHGITHSLLENLRHKQHNVILKAKALLEGK